MCGTKQGITRSTSPVLQCSPAPCHDATVTQGYNFLFVLVFLSQIYFDLSPFKHMAVYYTLWNAREKQHWDQTSQ